MKTVRKMNKKRARCLQGRKEKDIEGKLLQ